VDCGEFSFPAVRGKWRFWSKAEGEAHPGPVAVPLSSAPWSYLCPDFFRIPALAFSGPRGKFFTVLGLLRELACNFQHLPY
jgi:hypothetical protein